MIVCWVIEHEYGMVWRRPQDILLCPRKVSFRLNIRNGDSLVQGAKYQLDGNSI